MSTIQEKARAIRCLICDLDGVLTDGRLYYGSEGDSSKAFHVQDGLGIKMLLSAGIEVAVITGASHPLVDKRMQDLGISHYFLGQQAKVNAYQQILERLNLEAAAVAYVGDDLPDIPLLQLSGLAIAVPNAVDLVREHSDWITEKPGGFGAVREIAEHILHAQKIYQQTIRTYLGHDQ